jgi:acyl-homoserine-lactone acylase
MIASAMSASVRPGGRIKVCTTSRLSSTTSPLCAPTYRTNGPRAGARLVLPVSPYDVLAHTQRVLYTFNALNSSCQAATPLGFKLGTAGSNGWAIGPAHAVGNRAMLLTNPHLPWSDLFTLMEAQLTGPTISAYGAATVGLPVLSTAFNDDLGWTHTVSTLVNCTLYKLTLAGRGYRFDSRVRPFTIRTSTLAIRQPNGTLRRQTLVLRRAIQGPVVVVHGQRLAVRTVGVDQFPAYGALQEWWDMARAHSLAAFQHALARLQISAFMVLYADRQGHILSLYNGQAPVRPHGDYAAWLGAMPAIPRRRYGPHSRPIAICHG